MEQTRLCFLANCMINVDIMNKHIVAYPSEKCPLPSLFISHFLFWLEVGIRFVVLMVACSFQWI